MANSASNNPPATSLPAPAATPDPGTDQSPEAQAARLREYNGDLGKAAEVMSIGNHPKPPPQPRGKGKGKSNPSARQVAATNSRFGTDLPKAALGAASAVDHCPVVLKGFDAKAIRAKVARMTELRNSLRGAQGLAYNIAAELRDLTNDIADTTDRVVRTVDATRANPTTDDEVHRELDTATGDLSAAIQGRKKRAVTKRKSTDVAKADLSAANAEVSRLKTDKTWLEGQEVLPADFSEQGAPTAPKTGRRGTTR